MIMKKHLRIYLDTSVFGGVFDKEFRDVTSVLFSQIEKGLFELVTSEVVAEEIKSAPLRVQQIFTKYLPQTELLTVSFEAIKLQQAYLSAKILSIPYQTDALHVALATVAECSVLLSWNFKHIVHFQKVPLYNAINTLHGYAQLTINSPQEVIFYE
jgi:predicted nucleic acid-binding protein